MAIGYVLIKVDPVTRQAIEGEEPLDLTSIPMEDIDLLLVGKVEGPMNGLFQDPGDDDGSGEEAGPDSEDGRVAVFPPAVVRSCAERLAAIPRGRYTSFKKLEKYYSGQPSDKRAWYDDVVETAESVREFIRDAAARGHALECWLEGA